MSAVRRLSIDIETYSPISLKKAGVYKYSEAVEVLLVAWAWNEEPVAVWDMTTGEHTLDDVAALFTEADEAIAFNSNFERTVFRAVGVEVPASKFVDPMVLALQHSLPGKLETLCDVLRVPRDLTKDKRGKKLIDLFSKPLAKNRKLRRATRETHPVEWGEFIEYARSDVDAMRAVLARLPRWNDTPTERQLWLLDQASCDLGVRCDLGLAQSALRAFERVGRSLSAATANLTDGAVGSTTQRERLRGYLRDAYGFKVPDLTKGTVDRLVADPATPPEVRELLEVRSQASATSPAKYGVLLDATCSDGRLRGTIQFCGASRTGRSSGRLFQPQNLPRPSMPYTRIEAGIEAMKLDCEDLLFDNVSELCTNAVRGALIPAAGKKFVVSDLSNIEGRMLAWLAGEEWKLEAFRDYDAKVGWDLYILAYARAYGLKPEDVTKAQRQIGKVMELACLGPETQVLTDRGPVTITEVLKTDLLWDGVEWVKHAGTVARGVKPVVRVNGISSTADHLFLTTHGWKRADTLVSNPNILSQALELGSASLPSCGTSIARREASATCSRNALVERRSTVCRSATYAKELLHAAGNALASKPVFGEKSTGLTLTYARTMPTDVGCLGAYPLASTGARTRTMVATPTTVGGGSRFTLSGSFLEEIFSRTSSLLTGGTIPVWNSIDKTSIKGTSPATCDSSLKSITPQTNARSKTYSAESTNLRPVYDIAHAGPRNRFTVLSDDGALIVHNCGYQGAVGAFVTMGSNYGVDLPEDKVIEIVKAWRAANPKIRNLWYALESAAKSAISNPGNTYIVNKLALDYRVDEWGNPWLRMKLPSGRYLCYFNARLAVETCPKCDGAGKVLFVFEGVEKHLGCPECGGSGKIGDGRVTYEGVHQKTRQWCEIDTYGGKFAEQGTQGTARDVFMGGLRRAWKAGYYLVIPVHDEAVTEVPDDPQYTAEELSRLLATQEYWNMGLPLAAAGDEMHRYHKTD